MDNVTEAKIHFRKERWKQFILERQASGLMNAAAKLGLTQGQVA